MQTDNNNFEGQQKKGGRRERVCVSIDNNIKHSRDIIDQHITDLK